MSVAVLDRLLVVVRDVVPVMPLQLLTVRAFVTGLAHTVSVSVQRSTAGVSVALPCVSSKAMYGLTCMLPVRRGCDTAATGDSGSARGFAMSAPMPEAVTPVTGRVRMPSTMAPVWLMP